MRTPAAPPSVPEPRRSSTGGARALAVRYPIGMVWLGVVLFSIGPVLVADASISGTAFSFWRLWFGVVILGVAALVHRVVSPSRGSKVGWGWAGACGVAFALHQIMLMNAVKATSVVDVTLMNTVAPIIVALLAVRAFGERPGVRFRLWSLLAMTGTAAVVLAGSAGPEGDPAGMALAFGNVVFYALYFVGSKLARPHIDTVPFLFGVVITAALAVSGFVIVVGEVVQPVSGTDLLRALAVAVLPGAVGHFSVTWSLRWVPANVPPVLMLTIPVLSGAMAWLLVGQAVRAAQVGAGLLTLVGVAGAVLSPSARAVGAAEALSLSEES